MGKSINNAHLAADVPPDKVLTLVRAATTRWGNQYSQVSSNCKLRRAIDPADPAVEKFKRENRSNKEAIVEDNESDHWGSKVGRAVSAADLGLTTQE